MCAILYRGKYDRGVTYLQYTSYIYGVVAEDGHAF